MVVGGCHIQQLQETPKTYQILPVLKVMWHQGHGNGNLSIWVQMLHNCAITPVSVEDGSFTDQGYV